MARENDSESGNEKMQDVVLAVVIGLTSKGVHIHGHGHGHSDYQQKALDNLLKYENFVTLLYKDCAVLLLLQSHAFVAALVVEKGFL